MENKKQTSADVRVAYPLRAPHAGQGKDWQTLYGKFFRHTDRHNQTFLVVEFDRGRRSLTSIVRWRAEWDTDTLDLKQEVSRVAHRMLTMLPKCSLAEVSVYGSNVEGVLIPD